MIADGPDAAHGPPVEYPCPGVKVCIYLENFIFVYKCDDFYFLFVYLNNVLAHPAVHFINALEGVNGAVAIQWGCSHLAIRLGKPGCHRHSGYSQFGSLFDSVDAYTG